MKVSSESLIKFVKELSHTWTGGSSFLPGKFIFVINSITMSLLLSEFRKVLYIVFGKQLLGHRKVGNTADVFAYEYSKGVNREKILRMFNALMKNGFPKIDPKQRDRNFLGPSWILKNMALLELRKKSLEGYSILKSDRGKTQPGTLCRNSSYILHFEYNFTYL